MNLKRFQDTHRLIILKEDLPSSGEYKEIPDWVFVVLPNQRAIETFSVSVVEIQTAPDIIFLTLNLVLWKHFDLNLTSR